MVEAWTGVLIEWFLEKQYEIRISDSSICRVSHVTGIGYRASYLSVSEKVRWFLYCLT